MKFLSHNKYFYPCSTPTMPFVILLYVAWKANMFSLYQIYFFKSFSLVSSKIDSAWRKYIKKAKFKKLLTRFDLNIKKLTIFIIAPSLSLCAGIPTKLPNIRNWMVVHVKVIIYIFNISSWTLEKINQIKCINVRWNLMLEASLEDGLVCYL